MRRSDSQGRRLAAFPRKRDPRVQARRGGAAHAAAAAARTGPASAPTGRASAPVVHRNSLRARYFPATRERAAPRKRWGAPPPRTRVPIATGAAHHHGERWSASGEPGSPPLRTRDREARTRVTPAPSRIASDADARPTTLAGSLQRPKRRCPLPQTWLPLWLTRLQLALAPTQSTRLTWVQNRPDKSVYLKCTHAPHHHWERVGPLSVA